MKKWECSVCGYMHYGDVPPEKCPKCGAPKDKFVEVAQDRADLIERSRFTNGLLMRLATVMAEVREIAEKGIEDNLDPGCKGVFTTAARAAEEIVQSVKAEIKTHIGKGKWG